MPLILSRATPRLISSMAYSTSTSGAVTNPKAKARLRGVIFDMDGTLTVPAIDFQAMYKAVLGDEMYQSIKLKNPSGIDILHHIETWSPNKQQKAYQIIADFERQGLDRLQIMPGASELCAFLDSRSIRRGLITRNVKSAVDLFHQRFGLKFSPALSREFRPYKPDPGPLLHICSAWEVEPNEVMMIGDSLKDDVACGKRAGAFTCLLDETGRYDAPEYTTVGYKPDYKVSSLAEATLLLETNFDLLVQNIGNLPMVAKPLNGILSDALYIGGAHRIPYISIGVLLQVLSWGSLALIPVAGKALPVLMVCILLSNLGASITEVAKDALVAEYGLKNKMSGLQSYAFMALAAGGILGNLLGGYSLLKIPPRSICLIFAVLLSLQLTMSAAAKEESLGFEKPLSQTFVSKSVLQSFKKQYSDLVVAISEESVSGPLIWIVASIALVPILSGSIFCYQTQCLNLDPSIIGMSRVISQLMLLSMAVLYGRFWINVPMRKLIGMVQISYAVSLLLDLVLVKQFNLKLGIPNKVFALCFSGVAETIAQFKLLPFQMLLASLAPPGCEGSLMSFLASAFCLASIFSGFLGVGLASLLGITSDNYSNLSLGIVIQFLAALVSLQWIYYVPVSQPCTEKGWKRGRSKRARKNRRIGRVMFKSVYEYRPERESETSSY